MSFRTAQRNSAGFYNAWHSQIKYCTGCDTFKHVNDFTHYKRAVDQVFFVCKQCKIGKIDTPARRKLQDKATCELTQEQVREMFEYHSEGYLTWKINKKKVAKGSRVGHTREDGRRVVGIDGKSYYEYRLIWLYHKGTLPLNGLDHVDRDSSNNRIENLIDSTQVENIRNVGANSANKSGVSGVFLTVSGTWLAYISNYGKRTYIGYYSEFEDAVMARYNAEIEFGWDNRGQGSSAYRYLIDHGVLKEPK